MPRHEMKLIMDKIATRSLFDGRWIMVPFFVGLIISILVLLVVFLKKLFENLWVIFELSSAEAIIMALSLIDLTLVANLALIVALAGYENFVSKIETGSAKRPVWMGTIDFADMKMKLMASIVAISSIALLSTFMKMGEGVAFDENILRQMLLVHFGLTISMVILAVTDWITAKRRRIDGVPPIS